MASMRKKGKSGNYYARFYDRNRSPKRKEVPLNTSRKGAARRKLVELEKKYEKGEYDPWTNNGLDGQRSLSEAVDEFLNEKKGQVRTRTYDTYKQQLEAWEGHTPPGLMLRDVAEKHVQSYLFQLGTSNATKRKRYRHLRAFFNWAEQNDYVDAALTDDIRPPKEEKKTPAFLSAQQLQTLLETIDDHAASTTDATGRAPDVQWLKDGIRIAVCTGLRRGELVNVQWPDVDLDSRMITVRNRDDFTSKSGHERRIPLRGDAEEVMRRLNEERDDGYDGPVLRDRDGDPVKPDRLTKRFKFFVREAELREMERLRFHSLRHTTASWLAMKGVPLRVVQAIMGHSSISVTERYAHLQPDVMGEAMEKAFE